MVRTLSLTVLVLLVLPGFLSLAQEAEKKEQSQAKGEKERIEKLVSDLSSEVFKVREKAAEELEKIGESAVPYLKEALSAKDAEVRWRAKTILDKIEESRPDRKDPDTTPPKEKPKGKDEVEELFKRLLPRGERLIPENAQDIFKRIEEIFRKLEEGVEPEAPDFFPRDFMRRLEEMKKLFDSDKPFNEEMKETLKRWEELRKHSEKPEKEEMQGKVITHVRVWKDGKLVIDREEEFLGASILGLTLSSVSETLRYHLGIKDEEGLLVEDVAQNSSLSDRIEKFDIILRVDKTSVNSITSLKKLLSNKDKVVFSIIRKGKEAEIEVGLTKTSREKDK